MFTSDNGYFLGEHRHAPGQDQAARAVAAGAVPGRRPGHPARPALRPGHHRGRHRDDRSTSAGATRRPHPRGRRLGRRRRSPATAAGRCRCVTEGAGVRRGVPDADPNLKAPGFTRRRAPRSACAPPGGSTSATSTGTASSTTSTRTPTSCTTGLGDPATPRSRPAARRSGCAYKDCAGASCRLRCRPFQRTPRGERDRHQHPVARGAEAATATGADGRATGCACSDPAQRRMRQRSRPPRWPRRR